MAPTPDIFSTCTPRDDVLSGDLPDSTFAANLDQVVVDDADSPAVYRDAATFFEVTHPSTGLKDLLNEAMGRLSGHRTGAAPVIRLETNLGGGKTHNLIALWHVAHGRLDPMRVMRFMDPANLPDEPIDRVAVFVGTETGATTFPDRHGVRPRSLWGHLALQLGGPVAYEGVRVEDESGTAPGAKYFADLFGDRPALVLIDELARYLAVAAGHKIGDSTLARQTVAFLMSLMEAVDSSPRAVLVITTTGVTDAFGDKTEDVLEALTEASALMSRREHVIRPAGETDLPRILARRLFKEVASTAATRVGADYAKAASDAYGRGADLPPAMTGIGWAEQIIDAYPFHPSLLEVLDKRLSTIPNFNRTRGALRLLADTVRFLWEDRPKNTLAIHTHHIDLGDSRTVEELTSRIGRSPFEPVVRVDIASGNRKQRAHAAEVDHRLGSLFGTKLATTAYLWSLTEHVPGIATPDLLGSVLAPGDDHNVLAKSLQQLEQACWYLHADDRGWRFSTEASLVKLVQDAQSRIPLGKVRQEATDILGRQFKDAALRVRRSWEDVRVPDREDDATLVLFHWDDFGDAHGVDPSGPIPARITETWEKTPAGGLRQFRNRLVFLAPSIGTHDAMLDAVRRHLALKALATDTETIRSLTAEKQQELKQLAKESELLARVAVCNHVNVFYVPQRDGLETIELSPVTQAAVPANQTDAVVRRLDELDKTLVSGSPPLDPSWVRSRLGALLDKPLPTSDLARQFARRSDLKLVLDRAQITTLVRNGITAGIWEYQDTSAEPAWVTKDRPGPVRLADDTLLHPPGSAPVPETPACPLCGQVHTGPCASGDGDDGEPDGTGPTPGTVFTGRGSATAALAAAMQAARDAGRTSIGRIEIAIEETGDALQTQLARLHSVIPAAAGGATLRYRVKVDLSFDRPTDVLHLDYQGPPAEWTPLKPGIDHALKNRPAVVRASVTAEWDGGVPLDGAEADALAQRAADTGPARCEITLTSEATI